MSARSLSLCQRCSKTIQLLANRNLHRTPPSLFHSRGIHNGRKQGTNWNPFQWYNRQLKKYPLLTKSLSTSVLFTLGDLIAQKYMAVETLDTHHLLSTAVYGAFLLGPLGHCHFEFLEWLTVRRLALGPKIMPLVKMFIDQFTYWSPGILAVYHSSMTLMEGKSLRDCKDRLRQVYWRSLKACWCIWPAVMVVNFAVVPVAHQLNFVLAISVFWAALLSYLSATADPCTPCTTPQPTTQSTTPLAIPQIETPQTTSEFAPEYPTAQMDLLQSTAQIETLLPSAEQNSNPQFLVAQFSHVNPEGSVDATE